MIRIILLLLNLFLWIVLLIQFFSKTNLWKNINTEKLEEYFNDVSDKDIVMKMGYAIYRWYMKQLETFKIDTNNIVTKVDYSLLRDQIKNGSDKIIKEKIKNDNKNKKINTKWFKFKFKK